MKLIRKFLLFILLANFSFFSFAFEIDSTTFDQRIDTGGYKEYRIKNNSNKPVRYKINITKPDDEKADMSKWIKVYPKVMNIPPLQEGVLKIFAQSPKEASKGEYFCNLLVRPLIIPKIYKSDNKIVGDSSVSFVPVIELAGHVGDPKFKENIKVSNITILEKEFGVEIHAQFENNSFTSSQIGIKLIGVNNTLLDAKWLGKIKKNQTVNPKIISHNIKKKKEIKKILLYDSETLEEIKTIIL